MATFDDQLNSRLGQIMQMGSSATAFAGQSADRRRAINVENQQIAMQKQMAAAQEKWQQQQAATIAAQQKSQQAQMQSLISKLGSSLASVQQPTYVPQGTGGKSSGPLPSLPPAGKGNTFANFLHAISGQESGGNYGARNPSSGALGKYQVMPGNIASWSKAALGHSISAQQFLSSPQLQEQIAQHMLQNYYNRYGPAGAAVAWYAGEGTGQRYVKNGGRGFDRPQGAYPSINSYALSILRKMGLRG